MTPPTTADVIEMLDRNFGPLNVLEQCLVLAEEVGELCRAVVKRSQGIRGSAEHWTAEVRKEAADVLMTLHAIAGIEGFDLSEVAAERWAVLSQRDWTGVRHA